MGTYNRQKRRLLHSKSVRIDVKEIKRAVGDVQSALGAGAFAVAFDGAQKLCEWIGAVVDGDGANPPMGIDVATLDNIYMTALVWCVRAKSGLGDRASAEAMAEAEKLLGINPLDPDNIECAVKAAEAAGKPEAAAISVEAAYSCSHGDVNLLERVAQYYMVAKRYDKARDAYVKLSQLKPGDQRILQLLKNAEAQSTMSAGWSDTVGKKGGYQAILANAEQAKKINQSNKAVVVGDDAEAMIAEKKAAIAREPNNLNFYRALARIFMQNKRFPEAIETLQKAQTVSQADPELDRMLSQVQTANYEFQIEQLRKEGRTEEADNLEVEKNQFVFDDLAARVERYPNDLHLRFELGKQYFTYGYYDDALTHLQLAQKSPKDRLWALYYLAMCFLAQDQVDMGVMQLETARDAIPTMDDLKKKVVYQLGLCAEASGDLEKAYQYYKDVYSSDVGFEDLSERMLAVSQAIKARQQ